MLLNYGPWIVKTNAKISDARSLKSNSFHLILLILGHNAYRLNISHKIDNQVNCHSWITALELSNICQFLQGNHRVMLTWLLNNSSRTQWVGKSCSQKCCGYRRAYFVWIWHSCFLHMFAITRSQNFCAFLKWEKFWHQSIKRWQIINFIGQRNITFLLAFHIVHN